MQLIKYIISHTYLDQQGIPMLVYCETATASWVLKVKVKSIKVPISKVLDAGCRKILPCCLIRQHGGHSQCTKVPATNREHRLQLGVFLLEVINPLVPADRWVVIDWVQ